MLKLFIELIIEVELRGPGPPGWTCTPTTGYFYDKAKILRKTFEWNVPCFPLPRPNHLHNLTRKMQHFKRVLDLNSQ